jgi:hypothetical protein
VDKENGNSGGHISFLGGNKRSAKPRSFALGS